MCDEGHDKLENVRSLVSSRTPGRETYGGTSPSVVKPGELPAPRQPDHREVPSGVEALVPNAKQIVTEDAAAAEEIARIGAEVGKRRVYPVKPGERVLIVVDTHYDLAVAMAFVEAIHELASRADVVILDKGPKHDLHPWHDEVPGLVRGVGVGHRPPDYFRAPRDSYKFTLSDAPHFERDARWWETVAERYDVLFYGGAGPTPLKPYRYFRMPWRTISDLTNKAEEFPVEVWELIDEKAAHLVREAAKVTVTDPEGTEFRFTNYNDEKLYPGHSYRNRLAPSHIFGHPTYLRPEIDTTGVVAGTVNHASAFPYAKAHLENGRVVKVEGGGEYGELWRETLEETRSYQYRSLPGPGLFWLWEVAIGTNPKICRPPVRDVTTFPFPEIERRRAGIIHCGFGNPNNSDQEAHASMKGWPFGHVHIHLHFPTYTVTMPNGEEVTLIESGQLKLLEDPEVRELASHFGDPDDLLNVEWVPEIPGLNYAGDYWEDYAKNPIKFIKERAAVLNPDDSP